MGTKVSEVMTSGRAPTSQTPLNEVAQGVMESEDVGSVPVVEGDLACGDRHR